MFLWQLFVGQSLVLVAPLNNFSSLCCFWFRILSCIVLANIHTKSPHGGTAGISHQHHHHRHIDLYFAKMGQGERLFWILDL